MITDGSSGIAAALSECWSETAAQRCLVHVQRNVRTYLTGRPRTEAGKALLRLGRPLTRIHAPAEAAGEPIMVVHARQAPQGLPAPGTPRPGGHALHLPRRRIRRAGHRLDDQQDRRRNERPAPVPAAGPPGHELEPPEACDRVVPLPAQRTAPAAGQTHRNPPPPPSQDQSRYPHAAAPRPRALQHRAQRRGRPMAPRRLGRTLMTRPGFTHVLSYNP